MKLINPHRLFHGTWIPEWLDNRSEVSDGSKRLYALLCRFAGNKGEAFPSYQTLAERLQKSRRQIIRLIDELCRYELLSVTHVKDEVRGNRTNIYRFLWHPWMQLDEDEDYSLTRTDFSSRKPPSDMNVTRAGDTDVIRASVKNVTQKRVIYKERGKKEANQTLLVEQLPPPQKVLDSEKEIPKNDSKEPNEISDTDPWKSAKDAIESFKKQKLYPREWDKIISEIRKLILCATGEEALALKWYSQAAKAASLGLSLPPQQRQSLNTLTSQEETTLALVEEPKIKKPISNLQAEEKWLAIADLLQIQIPDESYQRWFSDIVAVELNEDRLFLAVPNRVYQSWIENNYRKEIQEASEKLEIKIFYQTYENTE